MVDYEMSNDFERLLENLDLKEKMVVKLYLKEKESEFKLKETEYKCEIKLIKNKLSLVNWENLKTANLLDVRSFIAFFNRRYLSGDSHLSRSDRFTKFVRCSPEIMKEWGLDPVNFRVIFDRLSEKLNIAAHMFFSLDKTLIIEPQELVDMELRVLGLLWELFPLPPEKLQLKIADNHLKPLFDLKKKA